MRATINLRISILLIVALVVPFATLRADMSVSSIETSLKQTVSAPSRTGWRVVESLRLQAPGLSAANAGMISSDTSSYHIALDERFDYTLSASEISSSIFKNLEVTTDTNGQQILQIGFAPALVSSRHCITDRMGKILFLVCTQQFENKEAIAFESVELRGAPVSVAPRFMAVTRKSPVQPMTYVPRDVARVPAIQPAVLSPPPVERPRTRLERVAIEKKVPLAQSAENDLYAFAPVARNNASPAIANSAKEAPAKAPLAPSLLLVRSAGVTTDTVQEAPARLAVPVPVSSQKSATPLPGTTELMGIEFSKSGQPNIQIPLKGEFQFTRRKISSEEYRVFLPNTTVAHQGLLRPFFVPVDVPGINAVVADANSDGITLRVLVEQGAKLKVERTIAGLELLVQA